MLTNLYIENMAVIKKAEIDFTTGLNILTGETGAGKSIVIDSINAVLGRRICKDIIRPGEKEAFISATFSNLSGRTLKFIEQHGYLSEDGCIIVQRRFTLDGKNTTRINGRPVSVSTLKLIGDKLINIHGQHESYGLFSQENHIKFLDKFAGLDKDLVAYRKSYEELNRIKDEIKKLKVDESEKARRIDLLNYQIFELESADLKEGELEELHERRTYLLNKEKIMKSLDHARQCLNGDEEKMGSVSLLELANDEISQLKDIYPAVEKLSTRLTDLVYEMNDCQEELAKIIPEDSQDDLCSMNEIEERISLISNLSRKYGPTVEEMTKYLNDRKSELEEINTADERLEFLCDEYKKVFDRTTSMAKELSRKREETSKKFARLVKQELSFLDMPNVQLETSIKHCELNSFGCDDVEFLISTNPGQIPKPISKVASGGELSRIMLGIKNVLSHEGDVGTLIFDEIDTGISGSAAHKVGLKLKSLSMSRQIICVTHLAQIAAFADVHFLITKTTHNDQTFTKVCRLNFESRKKELARIMGGVDITDLMLKNASEMLKSAKEKSDLM